ncbi:MAG: hypothetical protein EP338_12375 [Bacteroidetes bacterium]|nr:MAG: hypothetical protein EP338_12375 [Bacteroidota bacterium]
MLRFLSIALLSLIGLNSQASVTMTRVDHQLFVHGGSADFESLSWNDQALKKSIVQALFERKQLEHEGSLSFDGQASFEHYYKERESSFQLIDLNRDSIPELLFQGYPIQGDDKEYCEIYTKQLSSGKYLRIYQQVGHWLAYKIHPNTQEIVLYQHKYPCCSSMSHNIFRLRLLSGKIHKHSKYFLGRDQDMKGRFFPSEVHFEKQFHRLSDDKNLYWSDSLITEDASPLSQKNFIITYKAGSVYQILARKENWSYILIRGKTATDKSLVANGKNLERMTLFAWMKD